MGLTLTGEPLFFCKTPSHWQNKLIINSFQFGALVADVLQPVARKYWLSRRSNRLAGYTPDISRY